jgi:uncharacterized protein YjbI with pentapeptide repeats
VVGLEARDIVAACRSDACALAGARAGSVTFDGVQIVGGTLEGSVLSDLTWLDVVCERCDLSMIDWRGASLTRVVVRGCRVTGGKLPEGALESVRFVDCHMDYASFASARFRQVSFESCQLREADFHGADLAGTTFVDCELRGADFGRAKLDGTDLSASNAAGITLSPADVAGLVVSQAQAVELVKLFGVRVKG